MNIYYCEICDRICYTYPVDSELVCCNQPMNLLEAKTEDKGNEKHVPVVKRLENGKIEVKIGDVPHPMEEKHHIQWVFIDQGDFYQIGTLSPGDEPKLTFTIREDLPLDVYEYCNVHGLWVNKDA